jgi:hypothetical protein
MTKDPFFARVTIVVSLVFLSWGEVALAGERTADLPELYRSVAVAVVSIKAEVTRPAHSNFASALGQQGSDVEGTPRKRFIDPAPQNDSKS